MLAATLLVACSAGRGRIAVPDPGSAACAPEREVAGDPVGALTVVAEGPAGPVYLPHARSLTERLLVRHLYRTLVRVDCRGRLVPDLAEDWRREADGRRWRFRLAPATAPDGDTVTARAVVVAWREARLAHPRGARGPLTGVEAEAVGPRTLVVDTDHALASPALFARPAFAVAGEPAAGGWPGATGPYRTAGGPAAHAAPDEDVLSLRPAPDRSGPALRIVPAGRGRARDLIDQGADLVLTRDPGLLAYADVRPQTTVRPLPWDRTYLLLVPPDRSGSRATGARTGSPAGARTELRRSLARFAVRGAARPAADDGWWREGGCPADTAGATPVGRPRGGRGSGPGPALVHPGGDVAATDLAGRLAALAGRKEARALPWSPGGAPARTEPRAPGAFDRSLRVGSAGGYVLPVRRRALEPCRARAALLERVPWLRDPEARLLPLVATRAGLAVRRGLAGIEVDWDGVPRLGGVVRRGPP